MKILWLYLLPFACVLLSGCSKKSLSPKEYISWVNDKNHRLKVEASYGDYSFSLFYKPIPYLALKEYPDADFKPADIKKEIEDMGDFQYYTLEISTTGKKEDVLKKGDGTKDRYYALIQYFSFLMQQDLVLLEGNERLPCQLFQYERDYNLSPFQRFVIAFPLPKTNKNNEDRTIVYNDKVLGLNKEIKITIKGDDIAKLPDLKLN